MEKCLNILKKENKEKTNNYHSMIQLYFEAEFWEE